MFLLKINPKSHNSDDLHNEPVQSILKYQMFRKFATNFYKYSVQQIE